jgi:hypothetical protein
MGEMTEDMRQVLAGLRTDFDSLRQKWRDDVARLFETSQMQPLIMSLATLENSCQELESAIERAGRCF